VGSIYDASLSGGYVEYSFQVPVAGNYMAWGRVIANTDDDDSFYIKMDNGEYALWDITLGGTETWVWDKVNNRGVADPVIYSLEAGNHTLRIKQREDGAKIDRILITNNEQYVPQGTGESEMSVSDTQAPTVPANLQATAISPSQIDLTWTASTQRRVAGYKVYEADSNMQLLRFVLDAEACHQLHIHTVSTYDAAGNVSGQSAAVSATSQAADASRQCLQA
jgi:hypothetical protein